MTHPSHQMEGNGCGDTGLVGFLKDADISSHFYPADLKDPPEASQVGLLQGFPMSAVGGHIYCLIDLEFGLDIVILKLSLPQYSKSSTGTTYMVLGLNIR